MFSLSHLCRLYQTRGKPTDWRNVSWNCQNKCKLTQIPLVWLFSTLHLQGGWEETHLRGEPTGWRLKQAGKAPVSTRFFGWWSDDHSMMIRLSFYDIMIIHPHFDFSQLGPTTLSVWTGKNWQNDPTITIKCVDPAYRFLFSHISFLQVSIHNIDDMAERSNHQNIQRAAGILCVSK